MVLLNYLPVWSFMEITLVTAIVKIPRHMYPLVMLLFLSEYKFSTADNKSCVNQSIVSISSYSTLVCTSYSRYDNYIVNFLRFYS